MKQESETRRLHQKTEKGKNYDEDAINEELGKLKLADYAAAVFQAMTEKTGLTEGFMPLPAKKSRKSKEILRYVK